FRLRLGCPRVSAGEARHDRELAPGHPGEAVMPRRARGHEEWETQRVRTWRVARRRLVLGVASVLGIAHGSVVAAETPAPEGSGVRGGRPACQQSGPTAARPPTTGAGPAPAGPRSGGRRAMGGGGPPGGAARGDLGWAGDGANRRYRRRPVQEMPPPRGLLTD